jgi:hypothetical protein
MKKIQFLAFICVAFQMNGLCQLNKGTWMVGGSGSFSSSNYNINSTANNKTSSFALSATVGYFILPGFPIGIRSVYQSEKQTYRDASGTTGSGISNFLSVGPFVRYYFLPKTDRLVNLFAEANYSFGNAKPDITTNTYHFNRYSLLAGPVIYFNSSVGIEFTLGYFHDKPTDGRNATSGFQTGLGFQIHLEKNK